MLITFINKEGNFSKLETEVEVNWADRIEKVGHIYMEIQPVLEVKAAKKVVEIVEDEEDIAEEIKETELDDEAAMKKFLAEKKVRGYGLLKGDSLKKKAIEMGFSS